MSALFSGVGRSYMTREERLLQAFRVVVYDTTHGGRTNTTVSRVAARMGLVPSGYVRGILFELCEMQWLEMKKKKDGRGLGYVHLFSVTGDAPNEPGTLDIRNGKLGMKRLL